MLTKEQLEDLEKLRQAIQDKTGTEILLDKGYGMLFAIDPKEGDAEVIHKMSEEHFKKEIGVPEVPMFKFTRIDTSKEKEASDKTLENEDKDDTGFMQKMKERFLGLFDKGDKDDKEHGKDDVERDIEGEFYDFERD